MTSQRIRSLLQAGGPVAFLVAGSLLVAACGGGDALDTADDGVATLALADDAETQALGATEAEGSGVSDEDSALAFAACMRDEGIDFPDPTVDADGNPSFDGAFRAGGEGAFDPRSEEFRGAQEACASLAEGLTFGGGRGGNGANAGGDIQEALLPYTECLREEGLDVGDLQLGGGAGNDGDGNDGDRAGQGRQGPGGDPAERLTGGLGLDVEDPTVQQAMSTCQSHLDDAFADSGPGGPAAAGDDQ